MGHVRRTFACFAILLAGATAAAGLEGPTPSAAGPAADAANEKKKDAPSTAQRMLDAGVKAYEAGKADQAIRAFSKVLQGGGLENPQIARALYYRGLAYRKRDKPGLAISDLTSAIWLKNGLSPTEKQDALSNRVAAYREAGISDAPGLSMSVPIAEAPTGWQTATNGATAPSVATAPSPAAATPEPSSSSSGGIAGFFNDMFGGSSSGSGSSGNTPPVTTTASLAQNNSAPASGWTTTEVEAPPSPPPPPQPPPQRAAEPAPFVTRVAAAPPPETPKPPPPASPQGHYHVQVAAVRTRQEAYALSVRLVSQHGNELGGRRPSIDEIVIGSMGTFYRVRLGPYASAEEPKRLCGTFRASGFDCLVVDQ